MDLVFRYNEEAEDVEIVSIIADKETVLDTVGKEVVASWVSAWNNKHDYVQRVEIEKPVVEEPVLEEAATKEEVEETVAEEVADDTKE